MATDREELMRRITQGNFIENNGSVLRTINILRSKFNRLQTIKYALDIPEGEIIDCVNFLSEEGYIHLRTTDTKVEASLADTDFGQLEAKLTGKGIRLLAGGINDTLIKV